MRRNELLTPSAPLTSSSVQGAVQLPVQYRLRLSGFKSKKTHFTHSPIRELPLEGNSLAQIRHSKESIKFDFTWYLLQNSAGATLCSISTTASGTCYTYYQCSIDSTQAGQSVLWSKGRKRTPASVCLLPIEVGPCDSIIESWGFDIVAGECVQFNYGGCDGNGNRFFTRAACELRCLGQSPQDLCPDGNPSCTVDPCTTAICPASPAALCTSDLCDVNRQCLAIFVDTFGTPVNCDVVVNPCNEPILRGPCFHLLFNWGYNPSTNQCEMFIYSGCLGNQNNFISYAACAEQCIGVTDVDVCAQSIAVGPCTDFYPSWGFSSQTGECELFSYSGCGGNGNNFRTRAECMSTCEVVDVCTLPIDPGPCVDEIERFAFNSVTGQCEQFFFGGCMGNANNFGTLLECAQRCDAGAVPICDQPISPGLCVDLFSSWGFNSVTGQCEFFLATPCPGSENIFQSFEECAQQCNAPTDRCQQPIQVGDCTDSILRWGYNSATQQCQIFFYSGCSGNANSFDTREECELTCDIIANPCSPNPCNDGICSIVNNAASCNCEATFSFGQFCNMPIEIEFQNIASLTIPEGNEGTKNICLDPQIPSRSVDIPFFLSASPANTDLTFPTSSSIPMGQTCTSIQFSAVTDGILEGTETFQISLSSNILNGVNVDTNLDQFTIIITGANPCSPNPCNGGICSIVNNAASCNCEATFSFGQFCDMPILSASPANTDLSFPMSSSIPMGQTCTSIQFSAVTDGILEGTETFQISLSSNILNGVNVDTTLNQFTIIITGVTANPCSPNPCNGGICSVINNAASCNCEATFSFGQFCNMPIEIEFQNIASLTIAEGNEATKNICLDPQIPSRSVDIPFFLSASPANTDLTFPTSSSIPLGQTCTPIQFSAVTDGLLEGTETFQISLSSNILNGVNVDTNLNQFTIIITDANPCSPNPCNGGICSVINSAASCNCEATFSFGPFCNMPIEIEFQNIASFTIAEGSEGTKNICLDPQIPSRSVDIPFFLSANPANTDLTFPMSSSIPMGQTCTSIQFSAVTDGILEGTETFQISLSSNILNGVNVDTSLNQFAINVIDVEINIEFEDITVLRIAEGSSLMRNICLDPPTARNVITVFSLSASPTNVDLTFPTTSVIAGDQTCTSVLFSAVADEILEGTETFQISLTSTNVNVDANRDQFTIVVTDADVCAQPVIACTGTETGFSYDPASGLCVPITIGPGCTANGNFFATQSSCQERCLVPVCSQAIVTGPCFASLERFGYNSEIGQCQQFSYSGCGGTANRFDSLADCEQTCEAEACAQPIIPGPCFEVQTRFGFNSDTAACEPFPYSGCLSSENLFLSFADCQNQCTAPICSQAIDPGPCLLSLPRFGFNVETSQCEPFTYSGCGGTGNRFRTLADCQQRCEDDTCALPIDPGPCLDFIPRFGFNTLTGQCEGFNYGGCLGNENIFDTSAACLSRCIVNVCSLPLERGPCTATSQVWGFNSIDGVCQTFTYGGCLGNANRFAEQADCQARCEANICSQPQDPGPCSASLQSFSYNSVTNACDQFNYGGCLGGGNRFDTLAQCQQSCVVDDIGEVCSKIVDPGSCSDGLERFFYSPVIGGCQTFIYGGCAGNTNNFMSGDACNRRCVIPVCSQVTDAGICTTQLSRFSFNAATGQCQPFSYSGCGGNANRFNTLQECEEYCEVDICAQPVDPGPCSVPQLRFTFNSASGDCETFTYNGCLGSANRFDTFGACQDRCQADLCSFPLDIGPCNNFLQLFGFNTNTGVCEPFTYGGCLGNPNRFSSIVACQARCEVSVCLQEEDPGPCTASIPSFSFNSDAGTCGPFTYGGCLGGGNRFDSLTLCQATCEVPTGDPCSQVIDDGLCFDDIERFAYNVQTLSCQPFRYTGCGGNSNNFLTESACNQRCVDDVCAQPMAQCAGSLTRWSYNPATGTCVASFTGDCSSQTGNFFETEAQCQQRCQVPVCSQAIDSGPCTGQFTRFAFNRNTGSCQTLIYTGCGGTANNFISLQDCQQHCEVDVCSRPQETGPCSAGLSRVAFDDASGQCVSLTYGGCLGSSNRFTNVAECQQRCLVDVCTLPMAVGSCGQAVTMWWFNQALGVCEPFTYTGCEGNANRFTSQAACMQRCVDDICSQPFDAGSCQAAVQRFRFNSQTGQCMSFTYSGCFGSANNFASTAACQDRCIDDVCAQPMAQCAGSLTRWSYNPATGSCEASLTGDCRPETGNFFETEAQCQQRCENPICSQAVDPGPCSGQFTRFAFNSNTGSCQTLIYTGCGGTANNFISLQDCQQHCEVDVCGRPQETGPCSAGLSRVAYDDASSQCVSFTYGGCLGSSNRFTNVAECQQRCQVDVCTLPVAAGSCGQAVTMWWFNQASGVCEQFIYTGCEGNANRFSSQTACRQRCIDEVCTQPLDAGVCQAAVQRFRFNSQTGQCVSFTYSGCFGSANNFASSAACSARCNVPLCSLAPEQGPCTGSDLFFGYNPASGSCEQFTYGGCVGNPNRFASLALCLARCEVTNICNEVVDAGPCTAFSTQFFFNPDTSQCEMFQYGGCLGGSNRFEIQSTCQTTCEVGFAASCPLPIQDGVCNFLFCLEDSNCPTGELCCLNGCFIGMQCMEGVFVNVKAGSCPAIPAQDPAICTRLCEQDNDCPLLTKCCYTGCGTACMDPV
ncbi:Papilin [Holothuria leucospilota]|uniref:Papilin n=1 Tax=Holothuria leucospilota TaxID=206669 RepID=A0A9Q1H834_HOLLE|nr:Papilin [Holothuria leucospilota]